MGDSDVMSLKIGSNIETNESYGPAEQHYKHKVVLHNILVLVATTVNDAISFTHETQ
jgi:hypothetical protein